MKANIRGGSQNKRRQTDGQRKSKSVASALLRKGRGANITVEARSIGDLKLNPRNCRTHSVKQIRQIANSILAFGFTNPLLVNERGELIAGHGRYKAAQLLGF